MVFLFLITFILFSYNSNYNNNNSNSDEEIKNEDGEVQTFEKYGFSIKTPCKLEDVYSINTVKY